MEQKSAPETDDYRYFDPKLIKSDSSRSKSPINDAVVFVIGGGNYFEYQNLIDNAKVCIILCLYLIYNILYSFDIYTVCVFIKAEIY